jgi:AcrR family transcriptional regulator
VIDHEEIEVTSPETEQTMGRSQRKRAAIVEAARKAFLGHGYDGTSMDEIAARAGVSKQTIYKNFADKDRLFTEVMAIDIAEAERGSNALLEALPSSDDLERDLTLFARQHIREVIQPDIMRMRRIVIAEADRFPTLARTWYQRGPERGHVVLADLFSRLAERGLLRVHDPMLTAQHFNWLVLSIPLNEAMFNAADGSPDSDQLDYYADEGVRVFLAGYGLT